MRYRLSLPSLLTLGGLGLAACGEQATAPNTAADQPTAPQLAVTSNTWITRRDMPLDLEFQSSAVVSNAAGQSVFYAIGGAKEDSPLPGRPIPVGEMRAYNVATNSWTSKQDMPVARWGMNGAGVIDGKIYVTGGYTKDVGWCCGPTGTASLFVYDIASNTWTQKRNMPAAGGSGVTGVIRGQLYVVTFSSLSPEPVVKFFRYNPTTNAWTTLPSPTDFPSLTVGGGVIDHKLYLSGTKVSGGLEQSRVLEYDPITNQWTKKRPWTSPACFPQFQEPPPPPDCSVAGATAIMLAHLYVFGDETARGRSSPGIFIYDPVSNTWERKPLLTTFSTRDDKLTAARVFLNGQSRMEVIGGSLPGNNQQYTP